MSKPKAAEIEKVLRRLVEDTVRKGGEVRVNGIRTLTESELGFDEGFFKNDAEWKDRSKTFIAKTFENYEAPEQATAEAPVDDQTTVKAVETSKTTTERVEQKPVPQQRSSNATAKTSASTTPSVKRKAATPANLPETTAVKSSGHKATAVQTTSTPRREVPDKSILQPQTTKTPTTEPKPAAPKVNNRPLSGAKKLSEDTVDESQDESSDDSTDDGEDASEDDGSQTAAEISKPPEHPADTVPKVNGVKRKAAESSESDTTSSEDGSDGGSTTDGEPQAKKAKVDSTSEADEGADEDESDDDSEEREEADDEDESSESGSDDEEETSSPGEDSQAQPANAETLPQPLEPIPARTFKPPSGYSALSPDQLQHNNTFSSANLEGKQIWHITAPSNLPLSSLTEISLDTIKSGGPLMTHNNIDYVVNEDSTTPSGSVGLMIPSADSYKRFEKKIDRSLQIQQKITLPNLSVRQTDQLTGSTAAADVAQPATTNIRPQPRGLRMRYKPPGFGSGKPGMVGSGSDSAEEDEADDELPPQKATFQFPKALGAHGSSMGETAGGAVTNADVEMSVPKKTKKKKRKEKDVDGGSQTLVNGTSASPELAAASSVKKVQDTHGTALPNGTLREAESKEEKAKRKEEKRLRREQKEARRKAEKSSA